MLGVSDITSKTIIKIFKHTLINSITHWFLLKKTKKYRFLHFSKNSFLYMKYATGKNLSMKNKIYSFYSKKKIGYYPILF